MTKDKYMDIVLSGYGGLLRTKEAQRIRDMIGGKLTRKQISLFKIRRGM